MRERVHFRQRTGPNPLNHRDDFSRPALRRDYLNSLLQVAVYLPRDPRDGTALWAQISGTGFRVSGLRSSNFGYSVAGYGYTFSGFRFRVSGFGFRDSGFGIRVSGFGGRGSRFGVTGERQRWSRWWCTSSLRSPFRLPGTSLLTRSPKNDGLDHRGTSLIRKSAPP